MVTSTHTWLWKFKLDKSNGAFGVLGGRVAGGGCAAQHRDHVYHRREGRSLPALIRVTLQKAKETPEEASVATGDKVQTP